MSKPCHKEHPELVAGCPSCRLWSTSAKYRQAWGGDPQDIGLERVPEPTPEPPFVPCQHEGSILEYATCNCENKHVRNCDHPELDDARCTRGPNNGAVRACLTCPLRQVEEYQPTKITRPPGGVAFTWCHYGDLGDVVASLRAVYGLCAKHRCAAEYYLNPIRGTRELMTQERANLLLPLLEVQPYLAACGWKPERYGIALDTAIRKYGEERTLLADHYEKWLNEPIPDTRQPWLTVEPKAIAPVVINRTDRYHAPAFPWGKVVDRVGKQAVFLGLAHEHARFCKQFGHVPYYPTRDLFEAAKIIAGAKLFVGNQSACRNLAEGLKVPVFVEEGIPPDTHYVRPHAWYGTEASAWCPLLDEIHEGNQQGGPTPVASRHLSLPLLRRPGA